MSSGKRHKAIEPQDANALERLRLDHHSIVYIHLHTFTYILYIYIYTIHIYIYIVHSHAFYLAHINIRMHQHIGALGARAPTSPVAAQSRFVLPMTRAPWSSGAAESVGRTRYPETKKRETFEDKSEVS